MAQKGNFEKGRSWPVSRVLSRTAIHLGRPSPNASSNLPESGAGHAKGFLFGLAPGGVYNAVPVTRDAVRSYRTISPLPAGKQAVYFLLHWPSAHAAQVLPGTSPCGARTFLDILMDTATVWPTPLSSVLDGSGNYNLFTLSLAAFSFIAFDCIIQSCSDLLPPPSCSPCSRWS